MKSVILLFALFVATVNSMSFGFQKCENHKCCPRNMVCNCGENQVINLPVEMCTTTSVNGTRLCKPCNEFLLEMDPCKKFENCETCHPVLRKCFTCPAGRKGDFCEEEIKPIDSKQNESLSMKKRSVEKIIPPGSPLSHIRSKRDKTGCPLPFRKLTNAWVHCYVYDYKIVCNQTCVYGHTIDGNKFGPKSLTFDCTYRRKAWMPHDFKDCIKITNCAVDLRRPGSIFCDYLQLERPDFCNISCAEGDIEDNEIAIPSKIYTCQSDGSYSPKLPFCAMKVNEWPVNKDDKLKKTGYLPDTNGFPKFGDSHQRIVPGINLPENAFKPGLEAKSDDFYNGNDNELRFKQ